MLKPTAAVYNLNMVFKNLSGVSSSTYPNNWVLVWVIASKAIGALKSILQLFEKKADGFPQYHHVIIIAWRHI